MRLSSELTSFLTNCFRWESLPDKHETEIGFEVENYIFKYEPLYVARAETPIFDERFIGFGMTRNTQVRYCTD